MYLFGVIDLAAWPSDRGIVLYLFYGFEMFTVLDLANIFSNFFF